VYLGLALQNAWSHAQLRTEGDFDHQLLTLNDRLAESERLSITSQLFDYVLHEINDPLTLAMGYAELARNHQGLPAGLASHLDKIAQGVDQIATAARRFRSAIDCASLHRVPLSLADVLRQISRLRAPEWAAQKINASLLIQDAPEVLADDGQIQLAILSLLKNVESAITQAGDERELRISLSGAAEHARIEIFDASSAETHGKNISPQSTFTATRQFSGTTFRLALASSIVEQHNGQLRQSYSEKGNSVVLELPAYMSDSPVDSAGSGRSG
jgi:signal transduction histidine kinase